MIRLKPNTLAMCCRKLNTQHVVNYLGRVQFGKEPIEELVFNKSEAFLISTVYPNIKTRFQQFNPLQCYV